MSGILLAARHALPAKKPIVLPAIGDAFMGGFYAGIIDTTKGNIIAADYFQTGSRYALICSDKSVQAASTPYKTTLTAGVAESWTRWNGLGATIAMNSATYPAAQYCYGLSAPDDGASKWYLPAMDELELLYRSFKPTTGLNYSTAGSGGYFPGGTKEMGDNPSSDPQGAKYTASNPSQTTVVAFQSGAAQAFSVAYYWSATEFTSTTAWYQYFTTSTGRQDGGDKNGSRGVRPVRRLILA